MSSQKAHYDATMRAFFTSIQYRYDRSVVVRKQRTDVFNLFGHSPRASYDCTHRIRPFEIWLLACVRGVWSCAASLLSACNDDKVTHARLLYEPAQTVASRDVF